MIRLASGSFCVTRGGSWDIFLQYAGFAVRGNVDPGRGCHLGLRLVRRCT